MKCAFEDCDNDVTDDDYCEECGVYVCEEHNPNIMSLSAFHALEDHWAEEQGE